MTSQTTTPPSNIIDYTSQKRADSRAEKSSESEKVQTSLEKEIFVKDAERPKTENDLQRKNIEYVAEVIGSFIGTIRSGVRIFVENLRQRPGKLQNSEDSVMKEELKDGWDNFEDDKSVILK